MICADYVLSVALFGSLITIPMKDLGIRFQTKTAAESVIQLAATVVDGDACFLVQVM